VKWFRELVGALLLSDLPITTAKRAREDGEGDRLFLFTPLEVPAFSKTQG